VRFSPQVMTHLFETFQKLKRNVWDEASRKFAASLVERDNHFAYLPHALVRVYMQYGEYVGTYCEHSHLCCFSLSLC
jgi:hypothetical protein